MNDGLLEYKINQYIKMKTMSKFGVQKIENFKSESDTDMDVSENNTTQDYDQTQDSVETTNEQQNHTQQQNDQTNEPQNQGIVLHQAVMDNNEETKPNETKNQPLFYRLF